MRLARTAVSGTLALASAGALAGVIVLGGAQAAGASSLSGTIPYKCVFPIVGAETLNVGISGTAPASVAPGGSISLTGLTTSTTIPVSLVNLLVQFEHVTHLAGTVTLFDFNATGASPSTINGANGIKFSVPVHQNAPATIVAPTTPETVGPFTAGSSGTVSIAPGNIQITSKLGSSPLIINCTAPSSIPASETASITISGSPSTVPTTHTGEPWAGWPYWALVGLSGVAGLGALERAVRIRRRRA